MIRINRTLIKQAALNPTKNSRQDNILHICQMIDEQTLSVPLYQRDLSWTIAKSISLLNYQLMGPAPVAPLSINVINDIQDCVPQVSFIDRELLTVRSGLNSVVDGQQRITTNYKAYINHDDFRNIVLDLGKGMFVEAREGIKENQIPVGVLLFRDTNLFDDYTDKCPELGNRGVVNLLLEIRQKFRQYFYTINQAENLSEKEQIEWFEVLNNAGSRVSAIQLRFSKLKIHGIDIYKEYTKPFREKVRAAGIDDLFVPQTTTTSYPVSALNPAYEYIKYGTHIKNNFAPISPDTKEDQLCKLSADELKKCFALTLDALDHTLDFIENHQLRKPDRIDYINYLIGFYIFNRNNNGTIDEAFLAKWYNEVDFTNKSNSYRRQIYSELVNRS